jgi:transcription elongation factor GreB
VSRAFVDESASESREDDAPELKIPLPAGAKNYVTPQGAAQLRAEIESLLALEPDRVVFGTTVTVREPGGGEKTYRIVGVDEAEPARGWVSLISSLARALVGTHRGDQARVKLPTGEVLLTVRDIASEPR